MAGPLAGVRVIDATSFLFGPIATQMLGDMGADVIKVEPPGGDPTRGVGKTRTPLMGSMFLNVNRNKRSVVLDLKSEEGSAAMRRLLGEADVFVHNIRAPALRKLSLDYASLKADFPNLIQAAANGFGVRGRYFGRPAYDDVIQALSGLVGLNERASGRADYVPMLMADKICGLFLANAISNALFHREKTGRGQEIQVPMFESMVAFNLMDHLADGVFAPENATEEAMPFGYPRVLSQSHRPLPTGDGFICVIANTDAQWRRLFEVIGHGELADDPRYASIASRMTHIDNLYETIEGALRARHTDEWVTLFEAADVPAAPVRDLNGLRQDPHLADTGFFRTVAHDSEGALLTTDIPVALSDSPGSIVRLPPRLGQHTGEVLREIGLD